MPSIETETDWNEDLYVLEVIKPISVEIVTSAACDRHLVSYSRNIIYSAVYRDTDAARDAALAVYTRRGGSARLLITRKLYAPTRGRAAHRYNRVGRIHSHLFTLPV